MDLSRARIVLRPRRWDELFDLALRTLVTNRRLFGWISLFVLVPPATAFWLAYATGAMLPGAVWVLAFLTQSVLQGAFTLALGRAMFETNVRARTILRELLTSSLSLVTAWLLSWLAVFVGSLLAFIPAFIVSGRLAFVHEAVLLERHGPWAAIGRSSRLVHNDLLDMVGLQVLTLCAQIGAVIIAELVLNEGICAQTLQLGAPAGTLFVDGISAFALLGLFVATPFAAALRYLYYIDRRTRGDAWDIQLAFMALRTEIDERAASSLTRGRVDRGARA